MRSFQEKLALQIKELQEGFAKLAESHRQARAYENKHLDVFDENQGAKADELFSNLKREIDLLVDKQTKKITLKPLGFNRVMNAAIQYNQEYLFEIKLKDGAILPEDYSTTHRVYLHQAKNSLGYGVMAAVASIEDVCNAESNKETSI